jgi:hypothetical protein
MAKDCLRKIKIGFDNIFFTNEYLIVKENLIWGGKFKFGCLRTQLNFFQGLIEFNGFP